MPPDEQAERARLIADPASRTRLAWTRTAIAVAAIGAAMLKFAPYAGAVVLASGIPVWLAARHATRSPSGSAPPGSLRLLTVVVVVVAVAALVVVAIAPSPASLHELFHGR